MLDTQALSDPPARHASASPVPFACSWTDNGHDAAWVCLAGELDIFTSPQLERALCDAQRQVRLVVADLRGVALVDSSAIHALVDANTRAKDGGGRLVVLRGPPPVDRVLALSRACNGVEVVDIDGDELPAMALLRLTAEQRDLDSAGMDDRLQRTG